MNRGRRGPAPAPMLAYGIRAPMSMERGRAGSQGAGARTTPPLPPPAFHYIARGTARSFGCPSAPRRGQIFIESLAWSRLLVRRTLFRPEAARVRLPAVQRIAEGCSNLRRPNSSRCAGCGELTLYPLAAGGEWYCGDCFEEQRAEAIELRRLGGGEPRRVERH